jgi:hypothetical protein
MSPYYHRLLITIRKQLVYVSEIKIYLTICSPLSWHMRAHGS